VQELDPHPSVFVVSLQSAQQISSFDWLNTGLHKDVLPNIFVI
jgi:hypothetical protein